MKTKLFIYVTGILLIGISNQLYAQVNTDFNNKVPIPAKGKFNQNFDQPRTFTIPAKNIQALLEKEAAENQSPEARPFKIAEPMSVDIDVIKEATWTEDNAFAYGK